MSERYEMEIAALRVWFAQRLPSLGKVTLTEDEHKAGTDSLEGLHADLVSGAFVEWLTMRKYELSYNQMCIAFFAAVRDCNLLQIHD